MVEKVTPQALQGLIPLPQQQTAGGQTAHSSAPALTPTRGGPRRGAISRQLDGHYRAVTGSDRNHAEQKAGDLQARYDRQQATYSRDVFLKRKLAFMVKKSNQKFSAIVRNFRRALSDMRRAQKSKDPVFLSASLGRLMQCGGDVTGSVHEILSLATGVNQLDGQIKEVAGLVTRDELLDTSNRDLLSSGTLMKASLRSPDLIDASASLDVGHFERDWAASTSRDALDTLSEGVKMMEDSLREHREEYQKRVLGKGGENAPRAEDRAFSQYEVGLKSLKRQQAQLEQVLKALTG